MMFIQGHGPSVQKIPRGQCPCGTAQALLPLPLVGEPMHHQLADYECRSGSIRGQNPYKVTGLGDCARSKLTRLLSLSFQGYARLLATTFDRLYRSCILPFPVFTAQALPNDDYLPQIIEQVS
jgi:hypothetical protein